MKDKKMTAKSFIKKINTPFRFGLTKRQLRERKRTEKKSKSPLTKQEIYQQLYNAKKAIFLAQAPQSNVNPIYEPPKPHDNKYTTYYDTYILA